MPNQPHSQPVLTAASTSEIHRIMWSPAWDVATRAVGIVWTGSLFLLNFRGLVVFVGRQSVEPTPAFVFMTAVAARVAFLTFLALVMVFFVVRLKPLAKAPGAGARIVAVLGSYLPTCVGLLPRYDESAALNLASFAFIAVGNVLSVYGFSYLSRSASIMPEARRLVTTGPYRLVRHPVYLFEQLVIVGLMLAFAWPPRVTIAAAAILAGHLWCQFQRMNYEEGVLEATFPEYGEYRRQTARLIPGVY